METYNRINWLNKPVTTTPINSTNLNHMDSQIEKLTNDKADASSIPTKTSDLTNDANYQTESEVNDIVNDAIQALGNLLTFKGVIANYTALSALESPKTGDVWQVSDDSDSPTPHGANSEYYYDGTQWDYFSSAQVVELVNYYTKEESDARYILNNSIKALRYNNGEFEYTTDGETWVAIISGHNGEDGATFIPTVDDDGYISWENNKSLPNPATKNIKGTKGDTGYAPQVEVAENTATTYKLNITYGVDGASTLTTPNLKGANGEGSGDMEMATYDTNGDGIVNQADKVTNALTITQGETTVTYDGSVAQSFTFQEGENNNTFRGTTQEFLNLPLAQQQQIEVFVCTDNNSTATDKLVTKNYVDEKFTEIETSLSNKANKSVEVEYTLLSDGWVGDTYTISLEGITMTSNQEVLPAKTITSEQLEAIQKANIVDAGQSVDNMTLKAYGDVPSVNIPIRVIMRGDA